MESNSPADHQALQPLPWKVKSLPLGPKGSPCKAFPIHLRILEYFQNCVTPVLYPWQCRMTHLSIPSPSKDTLWVFHTQSTIDHRVWIFSRRLDWMFCGRGVKKISGIFLTSSYTAWILKQALIFYPPVTPSKGSFSSMGSSPTISTLALTWDVPHPVAVNICKEKLKKCRFTHFPPFPASFIWPRVTAS